MAANLIERSNHQRIGVPSSFEGRGELKKRTNFI
jgi:hypothetical protein